MLTGCQQYYKSHVEVGQCYAPNYRDNILVRVDKTLDMGAKLTVYEGGVKRDSGGYVRYEEFDRFTQVDCIYEQN